MAGAKLLLRLGATVAWSPLDLGPNVVTAWWNPDLHGNTAYMTDDGAGLISSFSSLNSKVAITAATTARPTWGASAWGQNSKAGLTFDGTANRLNKDTLTVIPTGSTAGEIWALFQVTSITGNNRIICQYGATTGGATTRAISTNNGIFRVSDGSTTLATTDVLALNSYNIGGAFWSGTTEGGRINGANTSPATATIGALATGTTRIRVGQGVGGAQTWPGVIRHLIITTLLSSAQRLQMEGFLAWDGWSSAASNPLPTSHPYKFAPPVVGV